MIVKMTKYEKSCVDYCKKHPSWDHHAIANDAYLNGYRDAKRDVIATLTESNVHLKALINTVGLEPIEVDFPDGLHQLNARTEAFQREKNNAN